MNFLRKLLSIIFLALAAVVISWFARENSLKVDLDLVFYKFTETELWLIVLFAFLSGIFFTLIILVVDIVKVNMSERKLKRINRELEDEVTELRNRSIADVNENEDIPEENHFENESFSENKLVPGKNEHTDSSEKYDISQESDVQNQSVTESDGDNDDNNNEEKNKQ
ncbi:MAG: LapA family protein [bacterium]